MDPAIPHDRNAFVARRIEDPGLPIKFGPCSNGEFVPPPLTPVEREAIREARLACGENARSGGMSRRQFLFTASAAATTLLALQGCLGDSGNSSGGRYTVPAEAGEDQDAARAALGGEEFIFDVQGHHLEYDLMPSTRGEPFFGSVFPQVNCGKDNPRACFAREVFLEDFFIRSDTDLVTLSALPIAPKGSPLSAAIMEETRQTAELACGWDSVLLHAQALPNYGPLGTNLEQMEEHASRYPIAAWKVFTHFPDAFGDPGNAWRLDDADPNLRPVGHAFISKARELKIKTICAHKGFGAGSRYASPEDVPGAARDFPDVNFIVYHSGFEAGQREGPYTAATANRGVNRLITAMKKHGVAPNQNVYAELGSTWWTIMRDPAQASHVLGKLLRYVGEDNVLWGTDCIFYGSPQDQIQTLRAFEISREFQERFGYPELTRELKAKILGLNGARVYGIEPTSRKCEFTRNDLQEIRRQIGGRHATYGPRNAAEVQRVREHHRGWPG
jgi:predicted TIM-barrel fold metal-dependent hydrolase